MSGTSSDSAQLEIEARRSRELGFGGMLCIHPTQVPFVNEAFRPTESEVAFSKRVVVAFRNALAQGQSALRVDGRFVDPPIARLAEDVLARDSLFRDRDSGGATDDEEGGLNE